LKRISLVVFNSATLTWKISQHFDFFVVAITIGQLLQNICITDDHGKHRKKSTNKLTMVNKTKSYINKGNNKITELRTILQRPFVMNTVPPFYPVIHIFTVPSQGHYGFHSFAVVDWFCLFIYLWVLTFPLQIFLIIQ
jgi:hypothetical protein